MSLKYIAGIDIGGTFTDVVLIEAQTGSIKVVKLPTTPKDFSVGFLNGLSKLCKMTKTKVSDINLLIHGTTLATNAILEGKTPKVGLITTKGFGDILEIARGVKANPYNLLFHRPKPLVPRYLVKEVRERVNYKGEILIPLNRNEIANQILDLKNQGVESIAVSLLFSFTNPIHELKIKEYSHKVCPEVYVTLSHQIAPEPKEYERSSTTVVNACLVPIVNKYVDKLKNELERIGVRAELYMVRSSGAVISSEQSKLTPVELIESGPAAGVVFTYFMAKMLGYQKILSFDMGGTSSKMSLVNKEPNISYDYQVGGFAHMGRFTRGSGYPILVPVIDLVEIGQGGGSIAWVDTGGVLNVGPQSSGADPGPACYKKGGAEPTITDAHLALGKINPNYFLGGEIKLDIDAANRAIREKVAIPLGLDVSEAANGIIQIALSNLKKGMSIVTIERGYDPREFALMAFGGAAPLHAGKLKEMLDIDTVIIPEHPGIASALGLLVSDVKLTFSKSCLRKLAELNLGEINEIFQKLESQGMEKLEQMGISRNGMFFQRHADVRYVGQSYAIRISIPSGKLTEHRIKHVIKNFHIQHEKRYGQFAPDNPVEMICARLDSIGVMAKPRLKEHRWGGRDPAKGLKSEREVFFEEYNERITCAIFERSQLKCGNIINGPAIIEEYDSTTVIYPQQKARIDKYRNIILTHI